MNQSKSSGGVFSLLWRLVATSVVCVAMISLYANINDSPSVLRTKLVMPAWVPFWPAFALPYLAMLLVAWVLPVTIRDARRFGACLLAMSCACLLVMPWWILFPTTMPRPPAPEDWWAGLYRGLARIDAPNNVMPCGHVIGGVVPAWFVGRERPTWRWPLVGMLLVGVPSIAFVWQHRPVDIVIGTVAAAIGIAAGEALNRRGRARLQSPA